MAEKSKTLGSACGSPEDVSDSGALLAADSDFSSEKEKGIHKRE